MKAYLLSVAGLGVGGAAYFGTDGPDYDRIVSRSPDSVYAAFSALAQEGTVTRSTSEEGVTLSVTIRVEKQRGEAIHYEILLDNRPVVTADLGFEAAGEDGRQTRMTAELELDEFELGSAFQTEAGVALSMVPEGFIDLQFANLMDDMVGDIEAGRPLPPLGLDRAKVRRAADSENVAVRRMEAQRAQRAASEPMTRPVPMVDPNRAARNNGVADSTSSNGWAR